MYLVHFAVASLQVHSLFFPSVAVHSLYVSFVSCCFGQCLGTSALQLVLETVHLLILSGTGKGSDVSGIKAIIKDKSRKRFRESKFVFLCPSSRLHLFVVAFQICVCAIMWESTAVKTSSLYTQISYLQHQSYPGPVIHNISPTHNQ